MAHELADMRIAIVAADGVERVEPEEPGGAHGPLTLIEADAVRGRQFAWAPAAH